MVTKAETFLEEYSRSLNAVEAAIHAGYEINTKPPEYGFYVYALICPINNDVFYIGKGKAGRMYHHVKSIGTTQSINTRKIERILDVLEAGEDVIYLVLSRHSTESVAYQVEDDAINSIGYSKLTNKKAKGGGRKHLRKRDRLLLQPERKDFPDGMSWVCAYLKWVNPFRGMTGLSYKHEKMILDAFTNAARHKDGRFITNDIEGYARRRFGCE